MSDSNGSPQQFPPAPDVADKTQQAAHSALGSALDRAFDDLGVWGRQTEPGFASRTGFQLCGHVLQLVANGWKLLHPGEHVFPHASGVSLCLRTLVDIHARQLDVWTAPEPEARLRGILAESHRQEQLALDAGERGGLEVESLRSRLSSLPGSEGEPIRVNVANVLEQLSEWQMLCVYRWESDHVHTGAAALAAGGRTLHGAEQEMDVGMVPISLWRVGQLTWALYGVGFRTLSHLTTRIGIEMTSVSEADPLLRQACRASALGLRTADEPPSPQYGSFDFSQWVAP